LLDGLDEVETKELTEKVIVEIRSFTKLYPKVKVILSSRMMEIFHTSGIWENFSIYKIEDFNFDQVRELITNWFTEDKNNGKQLIKLISQPMTLSTLPFTPLTLALIAILYQSGSNELPANLTELFQKYTELALGRWDMGKEISTQIDWKKKQLVMRKLSWNMLESTDKYIKKDEIKSYINDLVLERGLAIDSNLLYREMIERSGLLVKNSDGNFEFKHRAFMDYFAGLELTTKPNAIQEIINNFPNPIWSRVIFFACGSKPEGEGEQYLKAIIDNIDRHKCGVFHYAWQLGLLAQATYLAHNETKILAVKQSLLAFTETWDDLALEFDDAFKNQRIKRQISHLLLLFVFSSLVRVAIGSSTLSSALSQLVTEAIENREATILHYPEDNKRNEWLTFCLGIASSNANNIDDFIKIVNSNLVMDLGLINIFAYEIQLLLDDDVISESHKETLKKIGRNLKKKIKNGAVYLDQLSIQRPVLLNQSYIDEE